MSEDPILARVEQIWKEHLTDQPPQTPQQIKAGKALIELFVASFEVHDYDRARSLVSEDYIQHNPTLGTGRESVIEFAKRETEDPSKPFAFHWKRIFVDGEYVIAHNHVEIAGTNGVRVVEILRYQNGVFTEHWDTAEPVPPKSEIKNPNGVF